MCDKAAFTYPSLIKYVKAIKWCYFVFDYILDQCKTQEIYDRIVSEYVLLIENCPDKYTT